MMKRPLLVAIAILSLPGLVRADLFSDMETAMKKRRYGQAVDLSRRYRGKFEDLALLVRGNALQELGKQQEAIRSYDELLRRFPKSRWKYKAIFHKADAYLRLKSFSNAVKIFRAQLDRLGSFQRRARLATAYKKLSDKAAFPKDKKQKADYDKALLYYQKALEMGDLTPALEGRIRLSMAICHYKKGGYSHTRTALTILDTIMEDLLPKAPGLIPEARFYLAGCHARRGRQWEARTHYYLLARQTGKTPFAVKAAFELLSLYQFPKPRTARHLARGAGIVDLMLKRFKQHTLTPKALFLLAQAQAYRNRLSACIATLRRYLQSYPNNEQAAAAAFLLGQTLIKASRTREARRSLGDFLARYPASEHWQDVQKLLLDLAYSRGERLYKQKKYVAAGRAWEAFQKRYPLDKRNPYISYAIADSLFQRKQYRKAISAWKSLAQKYPSHRYAAAANYRIGLTYAEKLHAFDKAFSFLEKVKQHSYRIKARALIRKLKSPQLVLKTKRSFRGGEQAQVQLKLRNIKRLKVRVYNLDLRTYFRRLHTIRSIEQLDIELINPDREFVHQVRNYKKYRLFHYPLPLKETQPGAYLVHCSSEKLTATTLVIVSDLGLLLQASPAQVFAFVSNLKNGAPVGGATLLFSNGKEVFLTARTAADGTFRKNFDKQREGSLVSVFAFQGKHAASASAGSVAGFQGPSSEFLTHLATDRPAYRPGDRIRYKLTLRGRDRTGYSVPRGKFEVSFTTPDGILHYKRRVAPSPFGTIEGSFTLDEAIATGNGYLTVYEVSGIRRQTHSVPIARYEAQRTEVRFAGDKAVYFPGEKVGLTITLTRMFGAPAADMYVQYKVERDRWRSIKTDAAGRIRLSIDSTRYAARDAIDVAVKPAWTERRFKYTVRLLKKEYDIRLRSVRSLYVAGEKVRIAVSVHAQPGIARSRSLQFVVERLHEKQRTTEKTATISSDTQGKAVLELDAAQPGSYHVLCSGATRSGEKVRATLRLTVADRKDKRKLFLLYDQKNFLRNREASVRVFSGLKRTRALLTMERDGVLRHRLVDLPSGFSTIRFPVTQQLYPNFRLALTVADKQGFHRAAAAFSVRQGLKLKISIPGGDNYSPGDEVTLDLQARDLLGRSRESELFVVVIDDAVYQAADGKLQDITGAFARPYRFRTMRAASFTPFNYKARTRLRDKDVAQQEQAKEDMKKKAEESRRSRFGFRKRRRGLRRSPSARAAGKDNDKPQDRERDESADQLRQDGKPEPGKAQGRGLLEIADLAFYKAVVRTDGSGRKQIRFRLPGNLTRWRVLVVGTTKQTRFGMAAKKFVVRKPVFFTLTAPNILHEGDQVHLEAILHNLSGAKISGQISWRAEGSTASSSGSSAYDIAAGGSQRLLLPVTAGRRDIRLQVRCKNDSLQRRIRVKAAATAHMAGSSGISGSTVRLFPELPAGGEEVSRSLEIRIGRPTVPIFRSRRSPLVGGGRHLAGKASRLLRWIGHLYYLKKSDPGNRGEQHRISGAIRSLLFHFQVLHKRTWASNTPDVELLAFTGFALGASGRLLGIQSDKKLAAFVRSQLLKTFSSARDAETKALVLFALSWQGEASYAYLNRLYRLRDSLKNRELALLAIALANSGRNAMGKVVSELLEKRFRSQGQRAWLPGRFQYKIDWFRSRADHTALGALALLRNKPASPLLPKAVTWLLARRRWYGWTTQVENGLIPFVLGQYLLRKRADANYRVTVKVNGKQVAVIPHSASKTLRIPAPLIKQGKNRIVLEMDGRGRFYYHVRLVRSVRGYPKDKQELQGRLRVWLEYPPFSIQDKVFSRGYSSVQGSYTRVRNDLQSIALDQHFTVRSELYVERDAGRYFVVSHALPSGCRLLPKTISGPVLYHERVDNRILFWVKRPGRSRYITFRFALLAELPGKMVLPPPVAYPLHRPERRSRAKMRHLTVLQRGNDFWDGYKFSADELLEVGAYYFKRKQYRKAVSLLEGLLKRYRLRRKPFRRATLCLLDSYIALKNRKQIVKYFELLKERYPDLVISLDKARSVADAYEQMGEHERAYQLLAGITDALFARESEISGAYQNEGRIKDSVAFMERLFLAYPDNNEQRTTYYSLGQQLFSRATDSSAEELKKQNLTKAYLLRKALAVFERYLLLYPGSHTAAETAFSIVSLLIEREQYRSAYRKSADYMQVYARSSFMDSFHYMAAYALFFRKQFSQAITFCRKVANEKYRTADGDKAFSKNRYFATHMLGKIYHSMQDFVAAIKQYAQVDTRFPDAKRARLFLESKRVSIPEVTIFGTDEAARLKIRFKGIRKVRMTIYKVDFLILCLKEKNLRQITSVNLAGIKPHLTRTLTLADKYPYLSAIREIPIPVSKKGAYLVVLKANGVESSGMIIKSDVMFDVMEISAGGTARVCVRYRKSGRVIPGAVVKFIGSSDSSFQSAKTDLRGMAEVSGLHGLSTIVGEHEGHYCFHRGQVTLSPRRRRQPSTEKEYKQNALEQLNKQRSRIQTKNRALWDKRIQRKKRGLELQKLW